MSQRDSELKSVLSVWPRCDRAASGRLFGLSCHITLCSIQVLVQLRLFSNVNINTLDHLLLVSVSSAGNFSIIALVYMKELKNNAFVGDTARWCADTAM